MSDRYIAEVLDEACREWFDRRRRGQAPPHELRVNPVVYETIAQAKAADTARGNPLLLLGLEVVSVDGVPPSKPQLR
jgi:hypothetical protein